MPPHIKAVLSVIVIVVAICAHYWREPIGLTAPALLLFGLAIGMAASLWLFPEPSKKKPVPS